MLRQLSIHWGNNNMFQPFIMPYAKLNINLIKIDKLEKQSNSG